MMSKKHRLAYERYSALDFWISFPLALITLLSGIFAFFTEAEFVGDKASSYFSLAIGIMALVSTFVQRLSKTFNFGARAEQHLQVCLSLKNLYGKVNMDSRSMPEDNILESMSNGQDETRNARVAELKSNLKVYRGIYDQCLESCSSVLPIKISIAFSLLEQRLNLVNEPKDEEKAIEYIKMRDTRYEAAYSELYNAISSSRPFPYFWIKDPHKAVTEAAESVEDNEALFAAYLYGDVESQHKL